MKKKISWKIFTYSKSEISFYLIVFKVRPTRFATLMTNLHFTDLAAEQLANLLSCYVLDLPTHGEVEHCIDEDFDSSEDDFNNQMS